MKHSTNLLLWKAYWISKRNKRNNQHFWLKREWGLRLASGFSNIQQLFITIESSSAKQKKNTNNLEHMETESSPLFQSHTFTFTKKQVIFFVLLTFVFNFIFSLCLFFAALHQIKHCGQFPSSIQASSISVINDLTITEGNLKMNVGKFQGQMVEIDEQATIKGGISVLDGSLQVDKTMDQNHRAQIVANGSIFLDGVLNVSANAHFIGGRARMDSDPIIPLSSMRSTPKPSTFITMANSSLARGQVTIGSDGMVVFTVSDKTFHSTCKVIWHWPWNSVSKKRQSDTGPLRWLRLQ